MIMRTPFTIFLLIANFLIFGLIYYFEKHDTLKNNNPSKSLIFLEGEMSSIDRIELSGETLAKPRVLEKRAEGWYIVSPIEWPANNYAVQRIITQLQFLEKEACFPVSEILKSGHTLADYGLENPKLILNLKAGNKSIVLKIGDPTPVGNRLYILSAEGDYIFVMNKELTESLSVNIEDLRSQNIFDIPLFEIRGLTLQLTHPTNSKIRLVEQNQEWRFEAPIQVKASKQAVERTINQLTAAKIRSFVSLENADLDQLGLSNPWLRLTLYGNNRKQSLLLGNEVPNDNSGAKLYYARLEGLSTLFTVQASTFDSLKEAQVSLREIKLMPLKPNQISSISIEKNKAKVQLHKLETGHWQVLAKDAEGHIAPYAADESLMQDLLVALQNLESMQFVSDAPSSGDLERYGLSNPQQIIALSGEDEKISLIFGDVDKETNLLYVKLDSSNSVYLVNRAILNLFPARELYYRTRLLEEWPAAARIQSLQITDLSKKQVIFQSSIDPKTQSWSEYLSQSADIKRDAILKLTEQLLAFHVNDYLSDTFKNDVRVDEFTVVPWKYRLNAMVYLPALHGSEKFENIEYYFTERLGGALQYGGSPKYSVTFSLPQDLIDALFVLTFNKKLPNQLTQPTKASAGQSIESIINDSNTE